jgi:hypothetical protein
MALKCKFSVKTGYNSGETGCPEGLNLSMRSWYQGMLLKCKQRWSYSENCWK